MPAAELVASGGEWLLTIPVNPSIFCRIFIDFHWCWQWPFLETGRVGFGLWHQPFQTGVGISQEPKETVALTKKLTPHKCRDNTLCICPTDIRTAFRSLLPLLFLSHPPLLPLSEDYIQDALVEAVLIVLAVSGSWKTKKSLLMRKMKWDFPKLIADKKKKFPRSFFCIKKKTSVTISMCLSVPACVSAEAWSINAHFHTFLPNLFS